MKKSLLALAALAALSLVFVSCGGGEADPDKPESPVIEETTGGEEQPAETVKTGIILGETVYPFADLSIADAYNAENAVVKNSDGTLSVNAGSWNSFTINFSEPVDLSSFSKIIISAKKASDYTDPDAFVVGFVDSSDVQSRVDSWSVSGFMNPLTDSYADYEFSFDKISKLEYRDGGATTGANLSALSKIVFDPRGAKGNIVIASITVQ